MNFASKVHIVIGTILLLMPIACLSKKTVTLFSHGIAATKTQVHKYAKSYKKDDLIIHNDRYLIHTPFVSFNYPDATDKFYRVNYHETSFGQKNEIGRLNKTYELALKHYDNHCDIILWGLSRGASNLLIFAGLYQPDKVKALILESPYYTMSEVIENIMINNKLGWLPLSYGETVAEFIFKKYNRYGHSPANCIENIPKDLPIFIICSKEDHLVPYSSSMNVYKKLIAFGHKDTYIFIINQGKHANILHGPEGEKYQWVINAFYKKYNLPHCPMSAEKGESFLAFCQPHIN
jgi:Prolyl oligopeptidase family